MNEDSCAPEITNEEMQSIEHYHIVELQSTIITLSAEIERLQEVIDEIGSIVNHSGYGDSKDDIVGAIQEALNG